MASYGRGIFDSLCLAIMRHEKPGLYEISTGRVRGVKFMLIPFGCYSLLGPSTD